MMTFTGFEWCKLPFVMKSLLEKANVILTTVESYKDFSSYGCFCFVFLLVERDYKMYFIFALVWNLQKTGFKKVDTWTFLLAASFTHPLVKIF